MALTKVSYKMINDYVYNVVDYGADNTGATDCGSAFQNALNAAEAAGGGTVFFPTGTYLLDTPISLTSTNSFTITGDNAVIQAGTSFNLGGTNQLTNIITLQGNAATEITSNISELYGNFIELTSAATAEKGNRIVICDNASGSKWDTSNNNCRPTHLATVDYNDTTNNLLNFYPSIDFPVTVSSASTGLLSKTNIVAFVYSGDINVHITSGLTFKGNLLAIGSDPGTGGQAAGGASPLGLYLRRGVFKVEANFRNMNGAIRVDECDAVIDGCEISGGYNGNGINVFQRAVARVSNCNIIHCRHAISVGGSTSDGASAFIDNCILGGNRTSYGSSTYPSENYFAFDTHQAAKEVRINNCKIIGGNKISNGNVNITNTHIICDQTRGAFFFQTDSDNDQTVTLDNCRITLQRRMASYDYGTAQSATAGSGTFGSDTVLFDHDASQAAAATVTGWNLNVNNCVFEINDPASYTAPQVLYVDVGSKQWAEINFVNNRFYFVGTAVREIAFRGNSSGSGLYRLMGNSFYGCGVAMFYDDTLDQFDRVNIVDNYIYNNDTASSSFSGYGLQVQGLETSSGVLSDLTITGNYIESAGLSGGIFMGACPNQSVTVTDNVINFTASSGTVSEGLRTNRNQNSTATNFTAVVRGNVIRNNATTLTTGLKILGLAASSPLPVGFYYTGDNVIQTAGTAATTTGNAATNG